jgi:hypothetical protein
MRLELGAWSASLSVIEVEPGGTIAHSLQKCWNIDIWLIHDRANQSYGLPSSHLFPLTMFRASFAVNRAVRPYSKYTRLCRPYTGSPGSARPQLASTRKRNAVIMSIMLSAGGISALLLQVYNSPKLHADDMPSRATRSETDDSRKIRSILHGMKPDISEGVNVEAILKQCEETKTGIGVWYHLNQIARYALLHHPEDMLYLNSPYFQ